MKRAAIVLVCSWILITPSAFAVGKPRIADHGKIRFERNVPDEQAALLASDFETLRNFPRKAGDPELSALLKLPSLDNPSLLGWLEARVQFIVAEDFVLDPKTIYVATHHYRFENPDIQPDQDVLGRPVSDRLTARTEKTLMSNIGTTIYYGGKMTHALFAVRLQGIGSIPMTSPRVGILQIGPGLFDRSQAPSFQAGSIANSIRRLMTLFHEARHSDGNGRTLGFMHALCPKDHPYEGSLACDRSLNGPYTIGSRIGRFLTENCKTCTPAEREALRVQYLESASRIIANRSSVWDDAPEGQR